MSEVSVLSCQVVNIINMKHEHFIIFDVCVCVSDSPPKPSIYKHQQREVVEGTSVVLRCSAKMFCSSLPPALIWSTSTNVSIREQQRQNQSDLISDLHFNVTHQHHRVNFTCKISYQLQNRNTSARESMTLHVQCKRGIFLKK